MRSKRALYNICTNLLLQICTIIYGFIVPIIIIKKYGSNVNGLVSSITQFLAYITLLESGFGPVIKATLYKPIAQKNKDEIQNILKASEKYFKKISFVFLGYILLLCIFYPLIINSNFDFMFTVSLIIIISISTFSEYYFGITYRIYLQAEQKTYIVSLIQIFSYILSIAVIIIFSLLNSSIQVIKLASGLVFVLRPIIQNIYVKRKYNINLKNVEGNYEIKNKWDGLAQHIAAVIHGNTDITILTFFCTLSEISVYSVYSLVVKGIKALIQSFTNGIDASFGDMIAKNEMSNLNKKFETYEVILFIIITVTFSCGLLLITPFISIYTKGINDADYNRIFFGYLIVISEYIWAIRLPYSSLILAAGHFKETKKGAWVECMTNIVVSIILVYRYGIIGVIIGTIIAMLIRTCEFIYYANKYILKRSVMSSIKKIVLILVETLIIVLIYKIIPQIEYSNYMNWIINASVIGIISLIIVIAINYAFYKKSLNEIMIKIKNHTNHNKK